MIELIGVKTNETNVCVPPVFGKCSVNEIEFYGRDSPKNYRYAKMKPANANVSRLICTLESTML